MPSASSRFMHRRRDVRVGQAELAPAARALRARSPPPGPMRVGLGQAVAGAEEDAREPAQPIALASAGRRAPGGRRAPRCIASMASSQSSARKAERKRPSSRSTLPARAAGRHAKRSARAYCAAAWRCAPTDSARAAAAGAKRSTASASPAASAWWASRAGSGAPAGGAASAASAARCSAARRWGASDSSIAMRASSWRKATPSAVGGQHARAEALLEAGELVLGRQRLEQPELGLRLGHGDGAQQRRGRRAQARGAGEDGVADRRRDLAIAAGQHLGEEERVARRAAVELVGVDAVGLGELRDRLGRQPRQLAALDPPRRGQLAEHDPQRVAQVELVVAVGGDDEGGRRVRPCARAAAGRRAWPRRPSAGPRARGSSGARRPSSRSSAAATSCGPRGARRDLARARRRSPRRRRAAGPARAA